jgi:hypothetical protein
MGASLLVLESLIYLPSVASRQTNPLTENRLKPLQHQIDDKSNKVELIPELK